MTIIYKPNISITQAAPDGLRRYLFEILDFLRTVGWTIPYSSDGTTGGAGDHIDSRGDLGQYTASASRSWVVLRAPEGSQDLFWSRNGVSQNQYYMYYSRGGKYGAAGGGSDGDAWNTAQAPDQAQIHYTTDFVGFPPLVLHMAADDAAPYGWYAWPHTSGNFAGMEGGYACWPMTTPAEGDPSPWL